MKALRNAMTLQTGNKCHWTYRSRRTERARKTFTKFSDEIEIQVLRNVKAFDIKRQKG